MVVLVVVPVVVPVVVVVPVAVPVAVPFQPSSLDLVLPCHPESPLVSCKGNVASSLISEKLLVTVRYQNEALGL